jgi:hypothetical protein
VLVQQALAQSLVAWNGGLLMTRLLRLVLVGSMIGLLLVTTDPLLM